MTDSEVYLGYDVHGERVDTWRYCDFPGCSRFNDKTTAYYGDKENPYPTAFYCSTHYRPEAEAVRRWFDDNIDLLADCELERFLPMLFTYLIGEVGY